MTVCISFAEAYFRCFSAAWEPNDMGVPYAKGRLRCLEAKCHVEYAIFIAERPEPRVRVDSEY